MLRRWFIKPTVILSIVLLTACDSLSALPFSPEPSIEPSPSATAEPTEEPTPTLQPTQPPDMATFPLVADLYYLRDGRVWRQPATGDESLAEGLTSSDRTVIDFDVAPGDNWLATITSDGDVTITETEGERSSFISDQGLPRPEVDAAHKTISWSPDARRLAYITNNGFQAYYPGAGLNGAPIVFSPDEQPIADLRWHKNAEWLYIQRVDGTAALYQADPVLSLFAELGPTQEAVWLEDGRLAFSPVQGGLALLQPNDLEARRFIVPQGRFVTRIQQQRNGVLSFFVHEDGSDSVGFLHFADPGDLSFSPQSAVAVDTSDRVWNPTGTRLVSFDRQLVTLLDPDTGAQSVFEARSTVDLLRWGSLLPETVRGTELSSDLYFLATQDDVVQVWRLPADGDPPEVLTNAVEDIVNFSVSEDGTQVAYTSGRSIYRVIPGIAPDSVIIEFDSNEDLPDGQPAFDTSGTQLAYTDDGLWIADLTEAEPRTRRIIESRQPTGFGQDRLVEVYSKPRWSPDSRFLLADVGFFEGTSLVLIPITNRLNAIPIQLDLFGAEGQWLADGRILTSSLGTIYNNPGLRIVSSTVAQGEDAPPVFEPEIEVLGTQPSTEVRLTPDGRLVFLQARVQTVAGPTSLIVYSADTDGLNVSPISDALVLDAPTLAADGQTVAGLAGTSLDERSNIRGRIVISEVSSGKSVLIDRIDDAHALLWSRD